MAERKVVVKVDVPDDKGKQKAMKVAATISGISSISFDMKDKKMTIIGTVDPVQVVEKLRKLWHTDIVSIGPKEEPKKDEKKEEPKKEEPKKEEPKKEEPKSSNPSSNALYGIYTTEDDPNACAIC